MPRLFLALALIPFLLLACQAPPETPDAAAQTDTETRAVVLQFTEGFWNGTNIDVIDEIVADTLMVYAGSNEFAGAALSRATLKEMITAFRTAMPDLHYNVEDVIVEDERAMVRAIGQFTHTNPVPAGPFGLAEPTGEAVSYEIVFIYHLEEGRIVRAWDFLDALGRYRQMGVMPGEG